MGRESGEREWGERVGRGEEKRWTHDNVGAGEDRYSLGFLKHVCSSNLYHSFLSHGLPSPLFPLPIPFFELIFSSLTSLSFLSFSSDMHEQ